MGTCPNRRNGGGCASPRCVFGESPCNASYVSASAWGALTSNQDEDVIDFTLMWSLADAGAFGRREGTEAVGTHVLLQPGWKYEVAQSSYSGYNAE